MSGRDKGKRGRGGGGGGRGGGGGGGKSSGPKGRGHGLKPSQRREGKAVNNSVESKKVDMVREKLGGVVETMSDEQITSRLKKNGWDVQEACDAILAGGEDESGSESESSSEDDEKD